MLKVRALLSAYVLLLRCVMVPVAGWSSLQGGAPAAPANRLCRQPTTRRAGADSSTLEGAAGQRLEGEWCNGKQSCLHTSTWSTMCCAHVHSPHPANVLVKLLFLLQVVTLKQSDWNRLKTKQQQVEYAWRLSQGVEVNAPGMAHVVDQLGAQDAAGKPNSLPQTLMRMLLEGR